MSDCVFCKIVNNEIPSYKIWEDEKFMAFLNIFPNTEGSCLVAFKKHHPSYFADNDDVLLKELILAAKKTALILDRSFTDVKRTGLVIEGTGVDHLHIKLLPMHGKIDIESKYKKYFERYPGYLSSNDAKKADDKKLEKVYKQILRSIQK